MGREIERARDLLGAVTRQRVVPADVAARHYEQWVAADGGAPFSRYLIDEAPEAASEIRRLLRLQAVEGMPFPEQHTFERFEDLLMGQLGIEADLLSAKMLRAVRAVQDKKVREGKLRRLAELLPRAGFDPKLLGVLEQHLRERVMICHGCLGRYPRKGATELGAVACPRCGDSIEPVRLMESVEQSVEQLDPAQRQRLMDSAERVMETIPVAMRERPEAERTKRAPPPAALAVGLVLVAGALVGVAFVLRDRRDGGERPTPAPTPTASEEDGGGDDDGGEAPAAEAWSLAVAQERDRDLRRQGEYAELRDLWRRVEAGAGEDAAEVDRVKQERLGELDRLIDLAERTRALLARAEARPRDPEVERRLARLLRDVPNFDPPFGRIEPELEARRARRIAEADEAAAARVEELRDARPLVEQGWDARRERVAARQPLMNAVVAGELVRGVRLEALDADGFALRFPDDASLVEYAWDEDPVLSLDVFRKALDPDEPVDRLELLRRALLARDPAAARGALEALGLGAEAAAPLAAIEAAATSTPPVARGEAWRLRYPVRWQAHDLRPAPGTRYDVGPQGIALDGEPIAIEGGLVPIRDGGDIRAYCELEGTPSELSFSLELPQGETRRAYRVRWSDDAWRLELDVGAGANPLRSGGRSAMARRVGFELRDGRLTLALDGVDVARATVTAGYEAVRVRLEADGGELTVSELWLEGDFDEAWIAAEEEAHQRRVARLLPGVEQRVAALTGGGFPPLTVEDPQGLALATEGDLERIAAAKAAILAGDLDRARDELLAASPELAQVEYYLAYVALRRGDLDAAHRSLRAALSLAPLFPEAKALLSLVLARSGREDAAERMANEALDMRDDLAHAHLARVRAAAQRRDLTLPEALLDPLGRLRLPRALAPGDPIVAEGAQALERAGEIDRALPARYADARCVVAARTVEEAKQAAEVVDGILSRFERSIDRGGARGTKAFVACAPPDGATGDEPRYAPLLEVLLLPEVPAEDAPPSRALVAAAADAFVVRRFGRAPPWLELGLRAYLTEVVTSEKPAGFENAVATSSYWTNAQWSNLFALDRVGLAKNRLAQARAWMLVRARSVSPVAAAVEAVLDELKAGKPGPAGPLTSLDLATLEKQLRDLLEQGLR